MTLFPSSAGAFTRFFASSKSPQPAPSAGKVMPPGQGPQSTAAPDPAWGLFAAAVIAAALFLEFLQWPLLPRSLDMDYHMAAANGFRLAGGYVTHAFWEYAPGGRPHLYPPLLHGMLSALRACGLSPVNAARCVEISLHPLTLCALWAAVRKCSGPAAACFAVFLWASIRSVYAAAFNYPAETLALAFGLGAWTAFENRNRFLAALFLALAFYSHGFFSWMMWSALLMYGIVSGRRRDAALVAGASLAAAAPFLVHQFLHAGSFHFERTAEDTHFDLDLTAAALACTGMFLACSKKIRASAPLCLLAACAPFLLAYRARLTGGHGLIGAVWLAALAAEWAYRKIAPRGRVWRGFFLASAAAWVLSASPAAVFGALPLRLEWGATTLSGHLRHPAADPRIQGSYHEKYMMQIADAVRRHCAPDEIFWTDLNYAGALVSALSDRAASTAALREVSPDGAPDPVAAAKVAVCFKDDRGAEPAWVAPMARRYGLERVDETAWTFIYKNPNPTPRVKIPKPAVPSGAVYGFFGACILAAGWSLRR